MRHKKATKKHARSVRRAEAAGVGAGLSLAAAAAGLYYLAGTRPGKKVRRTVTHIAEDLKRDVRGRVRKVGITTERAYHRLVDEAAGAYERVSDIDTRELRAAARKVKGEWRALSRDVGSAVKKARRVAKRVGASRKGARR
ncbi:MAG: hypothetical protein Q8R39_02050 [bacterium]|nr:hypothetical protein [bacterium]